MESAPLIVSVRDMRRLEALLASPAGAAAPMAALLEGELVRADVREAADIPADVVTMNSEVVCIDEESGKEFVVRLVYPQDAGSGQKTGQQRVSVLAPIGAALLGLSVGSSITWPLPGGRETRMRVKAVTYQPEAAGKQE